MQSGWYPLIPYEFLVYFRELTHAFHPVGVHMVGGKTKENLSVSCSTSFPDTGNIVSVSPEV
jgi:hypothetical protein